MADTQEIAQGETDAAEERAKEIGREIGVVEDKLDEDVPDYEVMEEPDERIAKEREPKTEKKERPQLTNKEKRDQRKKRIAEKFSEKDALIAAQQRQIDELARWKSDVDSRLSGINRSEIDNAWNKNVSEFNAAEKEHMEAFKDGDGEKATRAMRVMYNAQRNIDQLQTIKAQIANQPAQEQAQPQHTGTDPIIVTRAKAWAERNIWYNPNGKDVDSEIAKAISGVLANEGYDPKTNDFWDELDERLAERIPEKVSQEGDEDDDEPAVVKPRKRAGPPVASGANRGDVKGKKTVTLPTSYINMLKVNGIWDDPKRRNKIIAERERILRESGQ